MGPLFAVYLRVEAPTLGRNRGRSRSLGPAEEVHEVDASSRRVTARERTFTYNVSFINVTTARHVSSNS